MSFGPGTVSTTGTGRRGFQEGPGFLHIGQGRFGLIDNFLLTATPSGVGSSMIVRTTTRGGKGFVII